MLLAGLRAQSPDCTFQPDFITTKFDAFKALLARHDIYVIEEWSTYETPNAAYSLLHSQAIAEIPDIYRFAKTFWKVPKAYTTKDYIEWIGYTRHKLVKMMQAEELPARWLRDWWSPHNINFGMLLGYPGEAISASFHDMAAHYESGAEPPAIEQLLPRDDFFGTAVGYDIPADVQRMTGPSNLFALWEAVIRDITLAYPTETVLRLPSVADEYEAYRKYDEGVV